MKAKVHEPPTGGQLLGFIVSAFDLHDVIDPRLHETLGKTGQRFFASGCSVRNPCSRICLLTWVFVGTPNCDCEASPRAPELFEPILFPRQRPLLFARLFTLSIHAHALAWDRRVRARIGEQPDMTHAFVRFAVLDLAVKTAWFRRREGLDRPGTDKVPAWADRSRVGEPLRELIDGCDRSSLEAIADRAGVSLDALKRWRRGKRRPNSENLEALLAAVPLGDRAGSRAELSRHYALAALARRVEEAFDAAFVRDLATVFAAVVACQMRHTEHELTDDAADCIELLVLGFSSWSLPPDVFLRIAAHHAPHWTGDIELATSLWRMPADLEGDVFAAINWACALHGSEPLIPASDASPGDETVHSHARKREESGQHDHQVKMRRLRRKPLTNEPSRASHAEPGPGSATLPESTLGAARTGRRGRRQPTSTLPRSKTQDQVNAAKTPTAKK